MLGTNELSINYHGSVNSAVGQVLTSKQRRLLFLIILSLAISFSPSKALGQFTPIIFFGGVIFFVQLNPKTHFVKFLILLLFYSTLGCIYYFLQPEFSFINFYVFGITASSFLVLLIDFKPILNIKIVRKISLVALIFLMLESIFGLTQGLIGFLRVGSFDISTGDIIRGTIEPSFSPSGLGGNQIFAILISTLLVFVLATSGPKLSNRRIAILLLAILCWVLASVLHTIIYFSVAIILSYLICLLFRKWTWIISRSSLKKYLAAVLLLVLVGILVPVLFPQNIRNFPYFLIKNLEIQPDSVSEKARATYNTLYLLPHDYPLQPIIGTGLGQYSSRASLIRSGEYLKGSSIPLPHYVNSVADRYILDLFRSFQIANPSGASAFHPFYSWLSLYGETGILGLLLVGVTVIYALIVLIRYSSINFPRLNVLTISLIFYVLLLGVHDNYWEFTQAIFPAFLGIKIGFDYLVKNGK